MPFSQTIQRVFRIPIRTPLLLLVMFCVPMLRAEAASLSAVGEVGFSATSLLSGTSIPWQITGVVLFVLLQVFLIIGLLVNRARRRQSEAESALIADISSKFVNLPPDQVDREIVNAQRRLCEFLSTDFAVLWQWAERNEGGSAFN